MYNQHGIDPTREPFWRDAIETDVVSARNGTTRQDAGYEAHCMVEKVLGREPLSPEDYRSMMADYTRAQQR